MKMIKTNKGVVEGHGTGIELMADLACIVKSLLDEYPKKLVMDAIAMAVEAYEKETEEPEIDDDIDEDIKELISEFIESIAKKVKK